MPHYWYEIRGKEPGEETVCFLYKIPEEQWTKQIEKLYLRDLKKAGVTEVTVTKVEE